LGKIRKSIVIQLDAILNEGWPTGRLFSFPHPLRQDQ
jgi:hypothetical protein